MGSNATCHFPSTVKLKDVLEVINLSLRGIYNEFSLEVKKLEQPKEDNSWSDFYYSRLEDIKNIEKSNNVKANSDVHFPTSFNSFMNTTSIYDDSKRFSFFYILSSDEGILSNNHNLYISFGALPIYQAIGVRLVSIFGGQFVADDCSSECLPFEVSEENASFPKKKNYSTNLEYENSKKNWLNSVLPLDFGLLSHFSAFKNPYPLSKEFNSLEPYLSSMQKNKELKEIPDDFLVNKLRQFEDEKLLLREVKKTSQPQPKTRF